MIASGVRPSPVEGRNQGPSGSALIIGCVMLVLGILAAVVLTGTHRLLFFGVVVTLVATAGLLVYLGVRALLRR